MKPKLSTLLEDSLSPTNKCNSASRGKGAVKTPGLQHKVSKKHHPGVSGYAQMREMQAKGSKTGYPGASSYAPDERSRFLESVRQGGGGGGGGGGSGM